MDKRIVGGIGAVLALAIIVAAVLFVGGPSVTGPAAPGTQAGYTAPAPAAAPTGPSPAAVVIVVDRAAILRQSVAGRDMLAQVEKLGKDMEAEFGEEERKLRADAADLQQKAAVLSAAARESRQRELRERQASLQQKVQDRQAAIQNGINKARGAIEQALAPILQQIMLERGANLLIERSSVILGSVEIDVTAVAIQRLDTVMTTVKVEPSAPDQEGGQGQ